MHLFGWRKAACCIAFGEFMHLLMIGLPQSCIKTMPKWHKRQESYSFREIWLKYLESNPNEFQNFNKIDMCFYPMGKPSMPHILRCQGFAVVHYSCALGRLGSVSFSPFATLGFSMPEGRAVFPDRSPRSGKGIGINFATLAP